MSLAPQSVYPRLVVKKAAANTDSFQFASRALFPYYDDRDKLTESDPSEYSIDSLPGTVYSLPRGSIFDFISFLPGDLPDFRMIPVEGSKSTVPIGATGVSGVAAPSTGPTVFNAQTPALFTNSGRVANKSNPIFKVAGSGRMAHDGAGRGDEYTPDDAGDNEIRRLRRLGDEPMALDEYSVKEFLGTDYISFELLLTDASSATDRPRGREEVLENVAAHFNVSGPTLMSVLSGQNKQMNRENVKLGIAFAVIRTMNDTLLARVTEDLAYGLATIINKAVDGASD